MDIKAGSVVISLAGHDKGRAMVVAKLENEFVYVADGKERKLNMPKKKNKKHVRPTHKLIELSELTDKKLRRTLAEMSARTEE